MANARSLSRTASVIAQVVSVRQPPTSFCTSSPTSPDERPLTPANTASRLEAANKGLKTGVLISAEAAVRSDRDDLVPMGRVTLRGRAQPVDVFTPRPDLTPEQRDRIAALVAAHAADGENTYVTCATAIQTEFGQDPSIMFLIERLNDTKKGESYVLS